MPVKRVDAAPVGGGNDEDIRRFPAGLRHDVGGVRVLVSGTVDYRKFRCSALATPIVAIEPVASEGDRSVMKQLLKQKSLDARQHLRLQIVVACLEGSRPSDVAAMLGLRAATISEQTEHKLVAMVNTSDRGTRPTGHHERSRRASGSVRRRYTRFFASTI